MASVGYGGTGNAPSMVIYNDQDPYAGLDAQMKKQQTEYMYGDGSGPSTHDSVQTQQQREHDAANSQQQQAHDAAETGRSAAQNATALQQTAMPIDWDKQKFNQIWPWLQGQYDALGSSAYSVGGQSGQGPTINANPIWNPNQINQQVNNARAINDQTMASRTRQSQESLAGRGFGANSPLAQAMAAQFGMQNLVANTDADRNIRWNAVEGNANQVLTGQQAREQQFASRQAEDIERRKTYASQQNALLGSLGALL